MEGLVTDTTNLLSRLRALESKKPGWKTGLHETNITSAAYRQVVILQAVEINLDLPEATASRRVSTAVLVSLDLAGGCCGGPDRALDIEVDRGVVGRRFRFLIKCHVATRSYNDVGQVRMSCREVTD